MSKCASAESQCPSNSDRAGDFIPYSRQLIETDDVLAVTEALQSDWLTTGPMVGRFEQAFAEFTGAPYAVAVSNGTAALHAAMLALGIGEGDEVIVPAMTFAATANCVVYQGGTPVFADVDPQTLLLDPAAVEGKITSRTRAVIAVDYAGQPCDYDQLQGLARQHGLALVDDACHALGGRFRGRQVGTLAELNTFSFHPAKHMTTGEGGMITTDDPDLAERMRMFRNHGISSDHRQREKQGTWHYEMVALGYNYRMTDFQCALGQSQLRKLQGWLARRREIARRYDEGLANMPGVSPLARRWDVEHAFHLYVVRLESGLNRDKVFAKMRGQGIGVNVHYIPVHLHPYYRKQYGTAPGLCPQAEAAFYQILSLPMHHALLDPQVDRVLAALEAAIR